MNQADRIRAFVMNTYIAPARARNVGEVDVRAGDIHRDMSLANAMPAVCSALGSNNFEQYAGVRTIARTGPSNGSNARFRFQVLGPQRSEQPPTITAPFNLASTARPVLRPSSVSDTVVLISCVKSKLPNAAEARDLYTSAQFRGGRRYAEATGAPWYVLSALYGLVEPQTIIAPYEFTLNTLPIAERRLWSEKTFDQLIRAEPNVSQVIILAGQRYREFLVPKLLSRGVQVSVPMEHLRQGEQLAWLSRDHYASE